MPHSITVTPDNFRRAETDLYFGGFVKEGGFGRFFHNREPTSIDNQTVIRMNRDTLYSGAVFDLDAGPVTITLPDPGRRFMSMQIYDEDEYSPMVAYGAGSHTLRRDQIGTRYVAAAVRILADPTSSDDMRQVHALQDAIRVQQRSPGRFETPNWDKASQDKVRAALAALAQTMRDFRRSFGARSEVDPLRHLVGVAVGWGGNPEKDAHYLNITPAQNDGKTVYRVGVPANVPVDGFWSISVYDRNGYFARNPQEVYSVNNINAKQNADGSIDVQFGGCDGRVANCIPITPGWNCIVRLYRPRADILGGNWSFPDLQAIQ
jgi:hypothetical protein